MNTRIVTTSFLLALALAACGDDGGTGGGGASSTTSTGSKAASTTSSASNGSGSTVSGASGTSTTTTTATGATASSSATGAGEEPDPNLDGPYTFADVSGSTDVAATGNNVPMKAFYPTAGPSAGPYPVILVGHGFQIPTSQYEGYAKRLASFGYVAVLPAFNASAFSPDNPANARDLLGGLDFVAANATLSPIADVQNVGTTGHSAGGRVAILAATYDARVKATITLDVVDPTSGCSPPECPDVSAMLPIGIPTGFLGETLDASAAFMACAPADKNYQTFYANAGAPSFAVTVLGANHMSFVDDPVGCGFLCALCNMATLDAPTVSALARSYVAAFFERHLRGDARYDAYLTGAIAQMRYVDAGLATIETK